MSNQISITSGAKLRGLDGAIIGSSGILTSVPLGGANGVATLDSLGKVPLSQLPASVVTYLGTWNASTNTPTLTNGIGDTGDLYICNVAGTVNFGAGPIQFFVGDQVIYSGSIWQRASGATGTVTSVALTESGDSLNITGSPITTSGTINIGFNGNSGQYINGAGNLTTFPSLTGFVPYSGATTNVDLGTYGLLADYLKLNVLPTSIPTTESTMSWNDEDGTMNIKLKGGNVTLQVGQEQVVRVVNKSGASLLESEYKVVRIRSVAEGGAQGQRLAVVLAQGDTAAHSKGVLGLVTETIADNQEGFITILGQVHEIDTTGTLQGETWVDGDKLYLSATTDGKLTKTPPVAPNHSVVVGYVEYAHAVHGKIFVNVNEGISLDELHNVYAPSPTNNQSIFWNSTNLRYENNTIAGVLGYTPANAATLINTTAPLSGGGDLSTNRTLSISQATTSTNGYLSSTDWNTFNNKQNAIGYTPANDALVVHLSGAETITGIKTFSNEALFGNGITLTGGYITYTSGIYNLTLNTNILTANRNVFLKDGSGTLAFTSDIPSLSGYVQGSGTTNYLPKFTGATTIAPSLMYDDGSGISIGGTSANGYKLDVNGTGRFTGALSGTSATFSSTLDVRGEIYLAYNATYGLRFYNDARSNWSSIGNDITGSAAANLVFKTGGGTALTLDNSRAATFNNNVTIISSLSSAAIGTLGQLQISSSTGVTSPASDIYLQAVIDSATPGDRGTAFVVQTGRTSGIAERFRISSTGDATFTGDVNLFKSGSNRILYVSKSDGTSTIQLNSNGASIFNGGNLLVGKTNDVGGPLQVSNGSNMLNFVWDVNGAILSSVNNANTTYKGMQFDALNYSFFTSSGTPDLTIASTGAATFSSTVSATQYTATSTGGSGLRVYGGSGTNQWDMYLNGANLRFSDNTGTGSFVVDRPATFSSSVTAANVEAGAGGNAFVYQAISSNIGTAGNWIGYLYGFNGVSYNKGATIFESTSIYGNGKFHIALNNASDGSNVSISDAKLTILPSGNVGIGTSSPAWNLHVSGNDIAVKGTSAGNTSVRIASSGQTLGTDSFDLISDGSAAYAWNRANLPLVFGTNATERMRITSDGKFLLNTTTSNSYLMNINGSASFGSIYVGSLSTGTVYSNLGVLTNTNPSDATLKNTIKPLTYGLAEIMQLQPKTFYYNSDTQKSSLKYGFIAQDIQQIMPDMVRKLSPDSDKLGLESDGIYVAMVNAIKELKAEIEQLKTQIK